jgi:hypothetical protein
MRTTLDIDDPLLRELKKRAAKRRISLGRLVSDLLAEALSHSGRPEPPPHVFNWISGPVGGRVDYADREALWNAIEGVGAPRGVAAPREKRRR